MILVVQRSTMYQQHISESLREQGLCVRSVSDYDGAKKALATQRFDMVLMDVDLGECSGFDLCREVRRQDPAAIVMFVSVDSTAADRVLGFELGASDFVRYPCHSRELQARVSVHLRHAKDTLNQTATPHCTRDVVRCGCITIDDISHEVWVADQPIYLTSTEYTLLRHLASHPNQVFSRAQLLDAVWGYQHSGYEHTVNSHMNRLRAKLPHAVGKTIATIWGVGYKMSEPTASDQVAGPTDVFSKAPVHSFSAAYDRVTEVKRCAPIRRCASAKVP